MTDLIAALEAQIADLESQLLYAHGSNARSIKREIARLQRELALLEIASRYR